MKLLFLDASPTMISKNLLPIADRLIKSDQNFEAHFVSLELSSFTDKNIERQAVQRLTSNTQYHYYVISSLSPRTIMLYLKRINPNGIVIGGYRVFDMLWLFIARRYKIKSFKLQHGFEIDSVNYKPFIVFTKLKKTIKMCIYLIYLSRLLKNSSLTMFYQYFCYIISGVKLKHTLFNDERVWPDQLFIYSEYYKNFWANKFGLPKDRMEIVGSPDLMMVPQILSKPRQDAVCYLTQTLVEDGRMKRKEFRKLMYEYLELAKICKKFIIKLHPRGDKSPYNIFKKYPNVEIVRSFPNCKAYVTHYSSTAFTAYHLSSAVLIHELPGHLTPDIFKEVASLITRDLSDITKMIIADKLIPKKTHKSSKVASMAPIFQTNPYDKVANLITHAFK